MVIKINPDNGNETRQSMPCQWLNHQMGVFMDRPIMMKIFLTKLIAMELKRTRQLAGTIPRPADLGATNEDIIFMEAIHTG